MNYKAMIAHSVMAACAAGLTSGIAVADPGNEAEDLSAAHQDTMERMAAERGIADAASSVTTHLTGRCPPSSDCHT